MADRGGWIDPPLPPLFFRNEMIQRMVLSIKTIAACQNRCSFCPVIPWMEELKGFETSLDDIKNLVYYSVAAGYHFKRIIFSGGEPLLWKHLKTAANIINLSGITQSLYFYTNALKVDKDYLPEFRVICSLFDKAVVSQYDNNEENVKLIKSSGIPNIIVMNREKYYITPKNPIPDSLPADCGCQAFGMVGNKITLCSFQDHMISYQNWNRNKFQDQEVEIGENFLSKFENVNPFIREMCAYCIGNIKVKNEL